ncbi:MAG TPA: hypothetical protein VGI10_23910 [Polyangiaceae bacterium]|jgi:hypothetical protein
MRGSASICWLIAALLGASLAHAEEVDDATKTAARALGTAGVDALQAGDVAGASTKLEQAYRILQIPSLGLWSARALVKRGMLVEAAERYSAVIASGTTAGDADVQLQAQKEAKQELAALRPRIPMLVSKLVGADAADVAILVDGKKLDPSRVGTPQPVNPGTHTVVGTRGSERVVVSSTVPESQSETVELRFAGAAAQGGAASTTPPPAPAMDMASGGHSSTTAFVVGGAGIAVLGAGAVFAAFTKQEDNRAAALCTLGLFHNQCGSASEKQSFQDHTSRAKTWAALSYVGFGVGVAALATGTVLLVTGKSTQTGLLVAPVVGERALGVNAETAW